MDTQNWGKDIRWPVFVCPAEVTLMWLSPDNPDKFPPASATSAASQLRPLFASRRMESSPALLQLVQHYGFYTLCIRCCVVMRKPAEDGTSSNRAAVHPCPFVLLKAVFLFVYILHLSIFKTRFVLHSGFRGSAKTAVQRQGDTLDGSPVLCRAT